MYKFQCYSFLYSMTANGDVELCREILYDSVFSLGLEEIKLAIQKKLQGFFCLNDKTTVN